MVISPKGLYLYDSTLREVEVLAVFPDDVSKVAKALHKSYAPMVPAPLLERELHNIIDYLNRQGAYLHEGDLVRIENGRFYGLKILPEVAKDLEEIYGEETRIILDLFVRIAYDIRAFKHSKNGSDRDGEESRGC